MLKGDNSVGEFYSVALTNNAQQADTGSKMVHIGKNTRSRIVSKVRPMPAPPPNDCRTSNRSFSKSCDVRVVSAYSASQA